jgi:toluene monooxygenase system ferredoxin subunit
VTWRMVARADDLWMGEMRGLEVEGTPLLLLNVDGALRAFDDRCPHQRSPLSQGKLSSGVLTCAAHHWEYDVRTGEGLNPRGVALRSFPVEVRDGAIWVDVPAPVRR